MPQPRSGAPRDYYEVLQLPKGASENDIKKSYRKLAVMWHPDKNPNNKEEACERFKEISEAYEFLSDKEKRRRYDLYGHDVPGGGGDEFRQYHANYGFSDAKNLFEMFFGSDPFANDPLFRSFSQGGQSGGGMFGNSRTQSMHPAGPSMFMPHGNLMGDDFFGASFGPVFTASMASGNMGGSSRVQRMTSSNSFGGTDAFSQSTSSSTRFVNGHRVTVTETKKTWGDGRVERQVTEQYDDGPVRQLENAASASTSNGQRMLRNSSYSHSNSHSRSSGRPF